VPGDDQPRAIVFSSTTEDVVNDAAPRSVFSTPPYNQSWDGSVLA
jgi:hypothetical protein